MRSLFKCVIDMDDLKKPQTELLEMKITVLKLGPG